ncbi:MAG: hypothetical protein ACKOXC_02925 [Aquirufa sp.]
MKKFIMMVAVATALFSCGQKQAGTTSTADASADPLGGTMTGTDEKTQAIQKQMEAYAAQDTSYAADVYADNIRVYYPSDTTADITDKKAFLADFKGQYKNWKDVKFDRVRVITLKLNNGETWTNIWAVMLAKGAFTGKDILIPLHRAMLWQGDKIASDIHLYDTKLIMEELAARAAAEKK